ncbi:MAG TPA: isochorismatase family protein [Pseudomonadales bacterium]|nr:isochorismatase family protein [Pseudomonadales bacterium]
MAADSVYERQNFGNSVGFGRRPALLIVDFQAGFVDPEVFGGGNVREAVAATVPLLEGMREIGAPVAYSRAVFDRAAGDGGSFALKVPGLYRLADDAPESQVTPELAPRPGELVLRKTAPSAFFGTPLMSWLATKGVDTLIVTGATTSGCVRASVVDSCSYTLRTVVAADCCGDRALEPHQANLFDMGQKYADLMTGQEALAKARAALAANA